MPSSGPSQQGSNPGCLRADSLPSWATRKPRLQHASPPPAPRIPIWASPCESTLVVEVPRKVVLYELKKYHKEALSLPPSPSLEQAQPSCNHEDKCHVKTMQSRNVEALPEGILGVEPDPSFPLPNMWPLLVNLYLEKPWSFLLPVGKHIPERSIVANTR